MLLNQFQTYLTAELRYSAHTVAAYMNDLQQYIDYIEPIKAQEAVKKDIRNYLAYLVEQGLEKRTVNRKLSAVKAFYKFLQITETISESPANGVKTLKFSRKVQIPYAKNEMSDLLDSDLFGTDFTGTRDRLVIEILYHTGMRKSELIGLKPADIHTEKKEIKVLGKGGKERIIPFNSELLAVIQNYYQALENEGLQLQNHFFVTDKGKSLYPKLVYQIVNSYLSTVTEKNKRSPHMLRHTFATHLLQNGAEINAVKEILGHSSLAATQVYTHSDIEQLKKVFDKAHPRESK